MPGINTKQDMMTVAQQIRDYLVNHPNAADSLEGIVVWWLTRQRYKLGHIQVRKALDYLVAQGSIGKIELSDGTVLYSATAKDSVTKP